MAISVDYWLFWAISGFCDNMFLSLMPSMHSTYHLPLLAINGIIFGLHYARYQESFFREGVNEKKTFSFGHCPNDGGGSTHARIFWPSF